MLRLGDNLIEDLSPEALCLQVQEGLPRLVGLGQEGEDTSFWPCLSTATRSFKQYYELGT